MSFHIIFNKRHGEKEVINCVEKILRKCSGKEELWGWWGVWEWWGVWKWWGMKRYGITHTSLVSQ